MKKKQKIVQEVQEEKVEEDNSTKINCISVQTNDEYQYFIWTNIMFAMENLHFSYLWDENEDEDEKDDKDIINKYLVPSDIINSFFSSEKKLKAATKLIALETLDELSDMCDPDPVAFSEEEVFLFTVEVLKSINKMFFEVKDAEEIILELKEPVEDDNTKLLTGGEIKKTPKSSNLN